MYFYVVYPLKTSLPPSFFFLYGLPPCIPTWEVVMGSYTIILCLIILSFSLSSSPQNLYPFLFTLEAFSLVLKYGFCVISYFSFSCPHRLFPLSSLWRFVQFVFFFFKYVCNITLYPCILDSDRVSYTL